MPTLAEVVTAFDTLYDPRGAASWDAVGLVCGDPAADVTKIMLAVDPVQAVVDDALAWGAQLVITHHPLFLDAVHGVAATDPKGRLVHQLVRAGCGLLVAHTNADVADPGVSDALADALGLVDLRPLVPEPGAGWSKIVVFVPADLADALVDAMAAAGAGRFGAYDRCAWSVEGEGTFRPGPGAQPAIGEVGAVERVREARVEMVVPDSARAAVVAAMRATHPYEEPAYDLVRLDGSVPTGTTASGHGRGTGRVGRLPEPQPLQDFLTRVARALPPTAAGVRATGRRDLLVETVAVCGGSGGSEAEAARAAGADAYVTADLRHHPASEVAERSAGSPALDRPMALVDVAHWASEWPWLPVAADRLRAALGEAGTTVETRVCTVVTDPWTLHVPAERSRS